MARRTRYQYGSVEINKRVTGPDVWIYRWWEPTANGRKKRRGLTVGTVEKYKTEAQALKAAEGMRLMANDGILARERVLFCGILDRFLIEQKQEQEAEQITYQTLASYRSIISRHIRPKWGDFYLQDVRPSLVQDWLRNLGKRLNKLKTEYSQDEVPLERGFILELKKWQALCVETEGQWLFPSPVTGRPYHADSVRTDYLVPAGLGLGLGRIGFHTFRHSYRAWLDETGAPVGVQQKLMRHAHISTTMDQYGNASMLAKRKANRPVVQRLLKRPAKQPFAVQ